jgi:hypothetical protein
VVLLTLQAEDIGLVGAGVIRGQREEEEHCADHATSSPSRANKGGWAGDDLQWARAVLARSRGARDYAMAWGGFIFVPINTRLAPPEIVFCSADSGCTGLFIDHAFLEQVRAHTPDILHVVYLGDGPAKQGMFAYEDLIAEGAAIADSDRGGDDLAGIFYTGGTTGRSKGAIDLRPQGARLVARQVAFAHLGHRLEVGTRFPIPLKGSSNDKGQRLLCCQDRPYAAPQQCFIRNLNCKKICADDGTVTPPRWGPIGTPEGGVGGWSPKCVRDDSVPSELGSNS